MFEKLKKIEDRFKLLEQKLCDPDIISNRSEYEKTIQERSRLLKIVNLFEEYKKLVKQRQDNKILLDDPDPQIKEIAREELQSLTEKIQHTEEKLKILLLPPDPYDGKDIFLEVRGAAGGEEACLFAQQLMRMYIKFADEMGWKAEVINLSESQTGGVKEAILNIKGKDVYSWLKYESGVHRVQRVPVTESQGRIHTSSATVAVLPEVDDVEVDIKEEDLKIEFMRASGAGGQHVNKTDSAVRITHIPTGITVHCQSERSQHKNKSRAMKILVSRLVEMERAKQESKISAQRKNQVGTGDRSEKIRTYNFPQNRVTDHRIGYTMHNLSDFLDGRIKPLIEKLRIELQMRKLKEGRIN